MADSKTFQVPEGFNAGELAQELAAWFKEEKKLDAQSLSSQKDCVVQARSKSKLMKWTGLDQSLQVRLIQAGDRLNVFIGAAQWIEQAQDESPGVFALNPLRVTAALGAWFHRDLPQEIFRWIEQHIFTESGKQSALGTDNLPQALDEHPMASTMPQRLGGRFFQEGTETQEKWLRESLEPDEIVLAWLGISSAWPPPSKLVPEMKLDWRYVLTPNRSAMVGFSKTGQVFPYNLPLEALNVTDTMGRDMVTVGEFKWKTQFNNDFLFQEIALIPSLDRAGRLLETARLNWVNQDKGGNNALFARVVLKELSREQDDPLCRLSRTYVEIVMDHQGPDEEALATDIANEKILPCLEDFVETEGEGVRLSEWAQRWEVTNMDQLVLVKKLLGLDVGEKAATLALPLHRQVRDAILKEHKDPLRQTVMDIFFAAHLLQAGQRREASEILENRLSQLPDESLLEFLPPKDVDLTTSGSQMMRCRILELLVDARGAPGVPDSETVVELARLQPLVLHRIDDLIGVASGTLKHRAEKLGQILEPGHLEPSQEDQGMSLEVHSIPHDLVQHKLSHPASRQGGTFEKLQTWLAKAKVPDYSALKSYAERITVRNYPHVTESLMDAALALGVSGIEVYVSRGEKSIGIRAFEGSPPFILIGGLHLDSESDFFMRNSELRFVIASEVAHLRFEHTRLTSNEVWDGVFHRGTQILDTLGTLAGPLGFLGNAVRGLHKLSKAELIFQKAEIFTKGAKKAVDFVGFARDVQQVADTITKEQRTQQEDSVYESDDQLLAACRVMQLTADRAGLVLCGDLQAAVRAVFLSSPQCHTELPMAERHGLAKALNRRNARGELINQDLAIRFAALCSFYLSDDYVQLREALGGI